MMKWKKVLSCLISSRLMSTSSINLLTKNSEKVFQSHLEKISGEVTHNLYGVARQLVKFQQDADEIISLQGEAEKDAELQSMAEKDLAVLQEHIATLKHRFLTELVDHYRMDPVYSSCHEVLLEVSPGVGGQEAMLFSQDLLTMYSNYASYMRWNYSIVHQDFSELGGLRQGSILINSPSAYKTLNLESGVHRVQRVPKTERAGRIHTSTSAVSILPTLDDVDIKIDEKDLKVETRRSSGAGGQHVNTTDSAVRMYHTPSGLVVDCQTERSQIRNRAAALKMLKSKLYQLEYERNLKMSKDLKKMQIGLAERSDKIRTYNFMQDRITDHRYSYTTHDMTGILSGGIAFDNFLQEIKLREVDRVLSLL